MNTTAMHESNAGAPAAAAVHVPGLRRFAWAVRRELWENRSLYLAPLAVAVVILVGFIIGLAQLPDQLRAAAALDPVKRHELIEQPYSFAALLLMFTTFLVAVFYCVDALYGERRDRSILFWKSLPVSDLETVLAKASIPMLVIPLLTFAITVATQAVMLLLASGRLLGSGLSLWPHLAFGHMAWMLFHHLVIGHGFWYAPVWGWLLLSSAWARRAPFLWATLPLLALGLVERIAFNTTFFGHWLAYRLMGGPGNSGVDKRPMTLESLTPASAMQVVTDPGFWFGIALAAVFLALAIRLRRQRGPA